MLFEKIIKIKSDIEREREREVLQDNVGHKCWIVLKSLTRG